jgi:hypothetical protein
VERSDTHRPIAAAHDGFRFALPILRGAGKHAHRIVNARRIRDSAARSPAQAIARKGYRMKLVRFGTAGREKPGVVDSEGRIRDLSGLVPDIAGEALYLVIPRLAIAVRRARTVRAVSLAT